MSNKLNETKLDIILAIKGFAKIKRIEYKFANKDIGSDSSWYDETEKYYYSLPTEILTKEGLSKCKFDFERVYYFNVTDKIMKCNVEDLGQFSF